ncbi:MAG: hypothetical protein ACRD0P_28375, partial [Stackebrandtia sp.]
MRLSKAGVVLATAVATAILVPSAAYADDPAVSIDLNLPETIPGADIPAEEGNEVEWPLGIDNDGGAIDGDVILTVEATYADGGVYPELFMNAGGKDCETNADLLVCEESSLPAGKTAFEGLT